MRSLTTTQDSVAPLMCRAKNALVYVSMVESTLPRACHSSAVLARGLGGRWSGRAT
jgi:hypothetical protein